MGRSDNISALRIHGPKAAWRNPASRHVPAALLANNANLAVAVAVLTGGRQADG